MILKNNNQKIELEEFSINEDVKQVLLGSLLGDGYLRKFRKSVNAHYKEVHSIKQKEYVKWKNNFLRFFNTRIHEYSVFDKRTNKVYSSVLLWSKVGPILTKCYELMYSNGQKSIHPKILKEIGQFGLAVWYMDDGYYHYGDYRCGFSTDAYSYLDHKILKKWLKEKFSIETQIHARKKSKGYSYTLNIPKLQTNKFLNLIKPYIHPSMQYKLGHLIEANLDKVQHHDRKRIAYRIENYDPKKNRKQCRKYREANREKLAAQRKIYYLTNKEKILKKKKEYYYKNRLKIRKKQNESRKKRLTK